MAFASPFLTGTSSENLVSSVLQANSNSDTHPVVADSSKLIAGQALMNDRRPSLEHTPEETGEIASDQISVYVVREGDTLSTIAKMFDVTENTIRWANDMNAKSVLQKDDQLIILPISGIKYTVKKGDSVQSIAKSFGSDKDEILSYNNLASVDELKSGIEIIIPNGEITTAVASTNTKPSKDTKTIGKSGTKSSSGYFMRPIVGGVRTQGIHGHNGIDLASSLNTAILAAATGKVIIAKQGGWNGGYGNYVVISHPNGMQTLYAHMNSTAVSVGQTVTQGSAVGYMGSTGHSSGIHLHFEVRGGVNPF